MENSEIQSSQFASTVEDRRYFDGYHESEVELIAKARRRGRKTAAEEFRKEYFYGRCKDQKTCIWPNDRVSWSDDSSGITWVGVHGNDSICVVTKAVDLDLSRVHGFLNFRTKEEVLRLFRRAVVSEIEDLVDSEDSEDFVDSEDSEDSEDHEDSEDSEDPEDPEDSEDPAMCGKSIQLPFGVVSVVPLNDKVHKASSGEYQENKIAKLLLERLDREEKEEKEEKEENEGLTLSDDDSEIDDDDEDAWIKYSQKLSSRRRRAMHMRVEDWYGGEDSIRFLKKEMERDASITINEAVQESIDEYDEKKAIEFLEEKVKRKEDFTLEGTVQTAIAAFQHLFKKKFKANEIEVCVMDPEYFVLVEEAYYKDVYVKHLETSEIEQVLAGMTESGGGGSSSGGSPMSSDGGGSSSGGSSSGEAYQ